MRRELRFFAGVAISIGIGAATDNLGIGIAIGIAFGAAFSQTKKEQKSAKSDSSEEGVVIDLNQMNRRKRKAKNDEEE
ncbi:MAG: hypothetical protein ACJZ15_01305 [Candidatus Neomarinimicrobiota bacterium]|nr:MAG: hypothetical protein CBC68_01750 [Candidatus Marinimicrobia bacterium TMED108]RCL89445.1 MAG: hypothetical protein DBW60_03965 [bacterium]|tara:strand:- start:1118 stop:1351 length:234 start_codon:yes stop_codon:yes gene_type:complete